MVRLATKGEYLNLRNCGEAKKKIFRLAYTHRYYLAGLFGIAFFYISVLLVYTHGALLFDGDNYGFYHFTLNLLTTPTGILEGFSLLLSFHDIYLAFYFYVFFSMLIALIAAFYFSTQFFKYFLPVRYVKVAGLVSSFLYIITPSILVDYYSTFLGNVSVSSSFFTLFLAFLIGSYEFHNTDEKKFLKMLLLGAIFLGLSVTLFPNDIRILTVGLLIFLAFIAFVSVKVAFVRSRLTASTIVVSILVFISASIVSSLFITFSIFQNIGSTVRTASVAAQTFSGLGFYTGSFNTIPFVIRLLGQWSFPTGYVLYHPIYFNLDIVNIASFFWPILSLIVPLIIAYKYMKNRSFFLFLMTLTICAIFWEKGGNAPFGPIWYFINSKLPFGYELIPTGFLSSTFLSKIYPVLAVLSIFLIFEYLRKRKRTGRHKIWRKTALIAIPIFLTAMLIVAEAPVFDGQLEANYFRPNSSGFFIPPEYSEVRNYVLDHPGNILILPGATTYITFSWNYSGTSYFYNAFFYPVNVTTNQNFGGGYGTAQQADEYINITSPIQFSNGNATLSSSWMNLMKSRNYTYILFDKSIIGGSLYENYTYTNMAIDTLISDHVIVEVYSGSYLALYRLNNIKLLTLNS